MFRRIKGASGTTTPITSSTTSNTLQSVVPISGKESTRWWSSTTTTNHVVILCLLLYIIMFQMVIYHRQTKYIDRNYNNNSGDSTMTNINSRQLLLNNASSTTAVACPTSLSSNATSEGVGIRRTGYWPRKIPPQQQQPLNPVIWKPYSARTIKLPYPIFVPSLPKSGTTSIWKFFKCGKLLSSHNWIKKRDDVQTTQVGICIQENIQNNRPPFDNCGDVDVYTDTGYLTYDHDKGERCYYPSIDGLDAIYESYPTATFVNVVRDTEAWYNSLKSWSHSSLFVRFRLCNATGFPNGQTDKAEFMAFYDGHNAMIRQFVADRPSLTYMEVKLESPETATILSQATGINAACWKQCKPQERKCEEDRLKDIAAAEAEEEDAR